MSFEPVDLSGYFAASWAESQLGEGGANKLSNCVEMAFALCLNALGLGDYEPQDLTDKIYGPGHQGGSDFDYVIWKLRGFGIIPRDLDTTRYNPALTVQAIHDQLIAGFPVIVEFKDDTNAQLVQDWHTNWHGTHASVAVACGPRTISIINVWNGQIQTFTHEVFTRATLNPAGNLVVFKRSLLPAPKPAPVLVPTPEPPAPAPLPAPAPTPEPVPDPVPVVPSPPVTPPVPEPAPTPPPLPEPAAPKPPSPPSNSARKVGRPTLILGAVLAIIAAAVKLVGNIGIDLNGLLQSVSSSLFVIHVPPVVQVFLDSPNGIALKVALGWIVLDALGTALLEKRLGRFDKVAFSYFLEKVGSEYIGLALLGIVGSLVPVLDLGFGLAIVAFTTTESTGAKDKIQLFIESFSKVEPNAPPPLTPAS